MPSIKTVLLLDDSATVRSLVRVHLMGRSLDFVEAADGGRALKLVHLMPIALIIADVQMPIVDGISFMKQLRSDPDPQVNSVPVILLTALRDKGMRSTALAVGANAFVNKPVASEELLAAVDRLLPNMG